MPELPSFFGVAPSAQNALDLFRGEWSSRFPPDSPLQIGQGPLLLGEDYRIDFLDRHLGSVAGQTVLELGPLEANHTHMLAQRGAAEIVAIEANPRAFLRCLVMKEVLGLPRAHFLLGDFVPFLETNQRTFDLGLACGVLYHLQDPFATLQRLAGCCRRLCLWTHYYDAALVAARPEVARHFGSPPETCTSGGFTHQLHRRGYGEATAWAGFCGGGDADARWFTLPDLLHALDHFGCRVVAQALEDHPHGPAVTIAAERR